MARTIIIKNTTGSNVQYGPITILATDQHDFTNFGDAAVVFRGDLATLLADIASGDTVINDGSSDLNGVFGRSWLLNDFDDSGVIVFPDTSSIILPAGTTAERPSSPIEGMMRYNTTLDNFETYRAGTINAWQTQAPFDEVWQTFTADTGSRTAGVTGVNFTFTGGTGITTAISGDELTITSTVAAGAISKRMNSWTLLSGNLYYNDFVHNLGTDEITTYIYDFATNIELRPEYTEIIDTNTLRVVVEGNTCDIVTNVVTGRGPQGPAGAPGAGSTIIVQDEGSNIPNTPHDTLNFVGAGVVATDAGSGVTTITIAGGGGGSAITVQDEGSPLTTDVTLFNFVGSGVTVTEPVTDEMLVTISGDLSNDTSPQLGGDLNLNQNNIVYTIPSTDLTTSGKLVSATVDTNATGIGAALYMAADGNFDETDADIVGMMPCRALAAETGTGTKLVLLEGYIRNNAWAWTPGGDIFVSTTTGALTQTAPSGSGDQVQKVGFAWTADVVYFNPGDYTVVEVA